MRFIKKRKNKKIILLVGNSSVGAILAGVLIYFSSTSDSIGMQGEFLNSQNSNLETKRNLNTNKASNSITDLNLQEIPEQPVEKPKKITIPLPDPIIKEESKKPEETEKAIPTPEPEPLKPLVVVPKPVEKPKLVEKPKQVEPSKPIEKPNPIEKPKPKPAPPIEDPKPISKPKPKPSLEKPIIRNQDHYKNRKFSIFGLDIEVLNADPVVPREEFQSDINAGITNRVPYVNDTLPTINKIRVTEELKKRTIDKAKETMEKNMAGYTQAFATPNNDSFVLKKFLEQNYSTSVNLILKYDELLRSPNLINFLTDEGKKQYPKLKNPVDGYWEEMERKARLINLLDMSKFNKLSKNALDMMDKGLIPEGEIKINANGEIDSSTFSPIANSTQARLIRDNSENRTFGYDTYFGRSPDDIKNNTYPGWSKEDLTTSPEFKKYNVSSADGITITKFTRDKRQEGKRNEGIVVTIDAANKSGYSKTFNLITRLREEGKEITGYKITNMGLGDKNQDFTDILKALPDKLPQLELVFESNNTSALVKLENKEIDELSLYTTGNALSDSWSLNPYALKNVAWVNTIDYNVSKDYDKRLKINSRIVFDALAFENEDSIDRINNGLRMAYFTRNNEPVFQGSMGPGLKPDHNEGGNSYPWALDLSRATHLKSLRGLIFRDEKKPANGSRKLKYLTLYNNSDVFEISADELNNSQFKDVMILENPQMPRTEIKFSNKGLTKRIKITSEGGQTLNDDGMTNLQVLKDFAPSIDFRKIYVNSDDEAIKNQLNQLGMPTEDIDEAGWA